MSDRLADWYRGIGMEPEALQLKARGPGVESWCKSATLEQALDTVRTYRRVSTAQKEFATAFRAPFIAADNTFRTKGNENELAALAAGCIERFLDSTRPHRADVVALATSCSRFPVAVATALLEDLETSCDEHLAERSVQTREPIASTGYTLKPTTPRIVQKLKETLAGNDVKVVADTLGPALLDMVECLTESSKALHRAEQVHRECSDVMWWLLAGRSAHLKSPFASLKPSAAPLILAGELAERTRITPGFHAATEFLCAGLARDRAAPLPPTSVFDAVSELDDSVLELFQPTSGAFALSGLTPCLAAIEARRTAADPGVWKGLHESQYPQHGARKYPAEAIARQAYNELMLRNSMTAWGA